MFIYFVRFLFVCFVCLFVCLFGKTIVIRWSKYLYIKAELLSWIHGYTTIMSSSVTSFLQPSKGACVRACVYVCAGVLVCVCMCVCVCVCVCSKALAQRKCFTAVYN